MKVAEIAILIFVFICSAFTIYWGIKVHNNTKIPCSLSEISPDFSNADREKCRVLRSHKL